MGTFDDWVGRIQTSTDVLEPARSNALDIALGGAGDLTIGDSMPLLHHWLYFWDVRPASNLGHDGHPAKGDFLPPVPLPRRMWAGGRLSFHKPLKLGASVTKTSTIAAINEKTGRTGALVFVTVRQEFDGGEGTAITEEQDLVYRAPPEGVAQAPVSSPPPQAAWVETVQPDSVLLFRYSALTMNGHRIHYDRPYALAEESYPGLVVHGPLQATLLMRLALRNLSAPVASFEYRGQKPAFDGAPLHVCGGPADFGARVWTQQGEAANMTATVRTSEGSRP